MEQQKSSNPPAFPLQYKEYNSIDLLVNRQEFGMTLKDYLVAISIQGILSAQTAMRSNGMQNNHSHNQIESLCEEAYQIADEILKQREL